MINRKGCIVVILPPCFNRSSGIVQGQKHALIQTRISECSTKAFEVPIINPDTLRQLTLKASSFKNTHKCQFPYKSFQPGVLLLQLTQPLGIREVHSIELAAPFVKGRIRAAILTAKIDNANAASACRNIPIICSSVNLLRFIFVPLCQEHSLFNGILFGGRVNDHLTLWILLGRNRLVHCQEGQDNLGKGGWGFILQMVRSTFELN